MLLLDGNEVVEAEALRHKFIRAKSIVGIDGKAALMACPIFPGPPHLRVSFPQRGFPWKHFSRYRHDGKEDCGEAVGVPLHQFWQLGDIGRNGAVHMD